MAVKYSETLKSSAGLDGFSAHLSETQDLFQQKNGISIIGKDFEDIVTTNSLYEEYVESLTEGFNAETKEQLETLSEGVRESILSESIADISPYASLTMPILVKLWARLGLKYAIPTEPVTQPAFKVAYMKPFVYDDDGVTKHYLPESINILNNTTMDLPTLNQEIALTGGKLTGAAGKLLTDEILAKGATLDRKFYITEVTYPSGTVVLSPAIQIDTYNRLYGAIDAVTGTEASPVAIKDTIMGSVDLSKGTIEIVTVLGTATKVKIKAYESSESHRKAKNVSFDMITKDISIGTGTHMEASLPLEFLQDVKAMYNIDGAATVVDLLSQITAQEVDMQIGEFLVKAYDSAPVNYEKYFNVYPSAQFAINPEDWLSGLRKVIDRLAEDMKTDFKSYQGQFVIVGHPIDVNLIPNVSWQFTSSAGADDGGVEVQYSLGAISGHSRYKILSSDLLNEGALYMFFVPSTNDFKTFTYYPYTFNVVNNYLNTRMTNVPSVMLTKRQTIEEFTPIIGRIVIQNNDGLVYADKAAIPAP